MTAETKAYGKVYRKLVEGEPVLTGDMCYGAGFFWPSECKTEEGIVYSERRHGTEFYWREVNP